jgi:trimethylamine--corrinoid protein Co-methyltransferase
MSSSNPGQRSRSRRQKALRKASASSQSGKQAQKVSLELVNSTEAGLIHDAVLTILSEVGVIVEHAPSRDLLVKQHGCRQGSDEYIRMPTDLVNRAISTVPDKVVLYDLDGNLKVDTSIKTSSFCPGHNCVRILDFRSGELRPCKLEDIRETAKLCEQLPNIDMVCSLGYPSEIPAEDEVVETVRAMYQNCSKPAALLAHDENIQERMMNLIADMVGGWNRLAEKPVSLELMGPISPLKLPDDLCKRLIN